MDQERFDQLARQLAAGRGRRGIVRQLAGAALGGAALGGVLAAVGANTAGAKHHRKPAAHGHAKDHQQKHHAAPPAADKAKKHKKKHRCPAGQTSCTIGAAKHGKAKRACVDLQKDTKHCGQCTTACALDETCQAGQCAGGCTPACAGQQCGADGCGGSCGTCASDEECQQGQCVLSACPGGCGEHGTCNAGAGACVCDPGYQTCSTKPCATDLKNDPGNCGGCGNVCASGICQDGQCGCPADQTLCDGQCAKTQSDPTNCGWCGNVCPEGSSCQDGQCQCQMGLVECNGQCLSTANDPTNCGACGYVCDSAHTTAVACTSGQCLPTCEAGFNDCSGTCVDLAGNHDNCGACGNVCTYPCSCQTSVEGVSFCTHGGYCRDCTRDADCALPGDPAVFYCVDSGSDICGAGYTTVCWAPC